MERGASPTLAARTAQRRAVGAATVRDLPSPRRIEAADSASARRGRLRRVLAGFGDSCALAAVALLACVGVIAVGTVGSLVWMLLLER
jgi:hypothetical protein